jgi:molybdate transport system substrate-binding protein
MNAMARAFTTEHPDVKVIRNFASSSRLAIQLVEGAPADVFASANPRQMALVAESGRIAEDAVRVFAHNRLVAITPHQAVDRGIEAAAPRGRPDAAPPGAGIRDFADIAAPDISMVLAAPAVPVRDYTDRMIESAAGDAAYGPEFGDGFYANLASEESNVRQVSARVALGEADLGVVYATDVTPDIADRVHVIEIPEEHNVKASYPIAPLEDAVSPGPADAFVDFVLSDQGRGILADYSFTLPEGTH